MEFSDMFNGVLAKYCADENYAIEEFPEIKFVESIWEEFKTLRPDLAKMYNKEDIEKSSGYTLFLDGGAGVVLIDKTFFLESSNKNFFWVETMIHEITHYRDYKSNLGIFGHNTYDSMLNCYSFWCWTEFHARYKGMLQMLGWVNWLPDTERKNYETDMIQRLDSELVFITSDAIKEMRCYRFMHLLGDIAAYNENGYKIPSEAIEKIFPDHLGYIEFLKSQDQTVDADFLTILQCNLEKNIV